MKKDLLYDAEKVFDNRIVGFNNALTSPINLPRVLPSVFIVGVQKGGTSSLYNALVQHPAILQSKRKETFFFGNKENYERGLKWYKQFYATKLYANFYALKNKANPLAIDASTDTFDSPEAPARIKKHIESPKIIVIFRNPVHRAFSHYKMSVRNGFELTDFQTALKMEQERIETAFDQPLSSQKHNYVYQRLGYRSRGIYSNYLPNWLNQYGLPNILSLSSEDFFNDPQPVYNSVCDFLEIERCTTVRFEKMNAGDSDVKIDTGIQNELTAFYKPFNAKLNELTGKEFNW